MSITNSRWTLGTVAWFDDLSGEGMVKSNSGETFYVHYSAIDSKKKRKSLKKDQHVKFKVFRDIHFSQVEKIRAD